MSLSSTVILCLIVANISTTVRCQAFQRLILPTSGSRLTVSPGLSFPSMQLSTIESGFTMKMPIQLQFPTMTDVAQTFFAQMYAIPGGRNADEQQGQSSVARNNSRAMYARVNSRSKFYETIETAHQSFGKSCLLRAICEVAEVPFVAASTGFLGEIFDMLLTSSPLFDKSGKLAEYLTAEKLGRESLIKQNDACKRQYSDCPFSLFKVMQIANEIA